MDQKQALRARVTLQRESLSRTELQVLNGLIQQRALHLPGYVAARNVALYSPLGNEVETGVIAEDAFRRGKAVFYPRVVPGRRVELIRVAAREILRPGAYGILEPDEGPRMTVEEFESAVVFVPGLAFDLCGNRLGRGHGAYDRLLAARDRRTESIGLAYELQIVGAVPTEPWDRRVAYIITERRTINCLGIDPQTLNRTC